MSLRKNPIVKIISVSILGLTFVVPAWAGTPEEDAAIKVQSIYRRNKAQKEAQELRKRMPGEGCTKTVGTGTSPITSLPEDVMLGHEGVLDWLTPFDLARCRQVSRQWKILASDPRLVRRSMVRADAIRTTNTGAEFIRRFDLEKNVNGRREIWQSPDGLILGEQVNFDEDQPPGYEYDREDFTNETSDINWSEKHCAKIGGRIPTAEEFDQLRRHMGAPADVNDNNEPWKRIPGYTPQVLDINGYVYTASSSRWYQVRFDGWTGYLVNDRRFNDLAGREYAGLRCAFNEDPKLPLLEFYQDRE
ncbi:MAG: F-box protein [Bdellovibrio sp.]|nr:F-box protein [Bdellovibrio sp.]